jgi:hypothetical protein
VDKNWYGSISAIELDIGNATHSLETFSEMIYLTRYGRQWMAIQPAPDFTFCVEDEWTRGNWLVSIG